MQFNISFYEQDQLVMTAWLTAQNREIASAQASRIAKAIECDSWAINNECSCTPLAIDINPNCKAETHYL